MLQPRRVRHSEMEVDAHLHAHDDDLDAHDRYLVSLTAKLDRILWALVAATITGATAAVLLSIQIAASP